MGERSEKLYEMAQRYIPAGVNSPVRAFKAVGGSPIFIERAEGSKIYDADGNEYIDYVNSWGPMVLGHAHPRVVEALTFGLKRGTSYGAPTKLEIDLARTIVEAMPSIELVRMVNSGTEATMSAIRVARGCTGRDKVIKFEGCYHGHGDFLLVKAGSGATTFGQPDSSGVPADFTRNTLSVPYNDIEAVERIFGEHGKEIACVIVEPVAGNMGVVPPREGFLEGLRALCDRYGAILIFDEVITGFRVAYGGAQELYGVRADLTCLGKIIGGGLPVGAYGGKREIMECVAPLGPVYQAGTLSGNPLAMVAGLETLKILKEPGVYEELEKKSQLLCHGFKERALVLGVPMYHTRVGSMFTNFFTDQEVTDYASAKTSDTAKFAKFFAGMLEHGINIAPSQFEAGFVSLAHTEDDIQKTLEACYKVLKCL